MVQGAGGASPQTQQLQRALAQKEQQLKTVQVKNKINDTYQQRLEGDLNRDIALTFGGLGGGRA